MKVLPFDTRGAWRRYSTADRWLLPLAQGLNLLAPHHGARPSPAEGQEEAVMAARERRHAAGLMRVNHAGEVAAQGLYHGQAATARGGEVAAQLRAAAEEERDHMQWCDARLRERSRSLNSRQVSKQGP